MIGYPMLIKHDLSGKITSLWFPDFQKEFEYSTEALSEASLFQLVTKKLLKYLKGKIRLPVKPDVEVINDTDNNNVDKNSKLLKIRVNKLDYRIRIDYDENDDLISLNLLNENVQLTIPKKISNYALDIAEYGRQIIQKHLENLIANNIVIPQPTKLRNIINLSKSKNDIWTKVYVTTKNPKGFFEKNLPHIGNISNFLSAACTAFITFLSIQLTTGKTDIFSKVVSVTGAVIGFLFTLIIYTYSSTTSDLEKFGRRIDDKFRNKNEDLANTIEPTLTGSRSHISSTTKILVHIGFNLFVIANTAASVITTFQEIDAVGEKASKKYSYIKPELIFLIAMISNITNAISTYSFETSFAKALLDDLFQKWEQRAFNKNDKNLLPIDLIENNSESSKLIDEPGNPQSQEHTKLLEAGYNKRL